jgi:hypothetical protein
MKIFQGGVAETVPRYQLSEAFANDFVVLQFVELIGGHKPNVASSQFARLSAICSLVNTYKAMPAMPAHTP